MENFLNIVVVLCICVEIILIFTLMDSLQRLKRPSRASLLKRPRRAVVHKAGLLSTSFSKAKTEQAIRGRRSIDKTNFCDRCMSSIDCCTTCDHLPTFLKPKIGVV